MSYRPLAACLIVLAAACNQKPQTDYRLNQAPLIYEDPEPEIINTKWGPMTRAEYQDELRRRRIQEAEQARIQENPVPQPPVTPQPPIAPDPEITQKLVSEQQKKPVPPPPVYVPDPVSTPTSSPGATKR